MAKKLSTDEILKAARAQAGQSGGEEVKARGPAQEPPGEPAAQHPAEPPVPAVRPAATGAVPAAPKSTKDILAAARAQAGGGSETATPSPVKSAVNQGEQTARVPVAGAPKSTKDILAAARSQAVGGAAPEAPAAKASAPKAAASGAKSTTDILAAARAQAGGAPAPESSQKPVAAKGAKAAAVKSAPASAAAVPAGARPSVQEMLKAVREGKPADETAVSKPAQPALVIPQKPAPAAKTAIVVPEQRRGFLATIGGGLIAVFWVLLGTPFRAAWTSFGATMGLWGLESARFMMPNVLVEPPSKFKVGPPKDYPPAAVSTKWTAQYGVWIVRNDYKGKDMIYAIQTVCTHLGCTPNWLEGERKFKCPCHGSGFYITGVNFEGPAPRPLERMAIRLAEDGMLEVDKSRKFQEELGQWEDPASFVPVV